MKNFVFTAGLILVSFLFSCNKSLKLKGGESSGKIDMNKNIHFQPLPTELMHSEILFDSYELDNRIEEEKESLISDNTTLQEFNIVSSTFRTIHIQENTFANSQNHFNTNEYIDYFEVIVTSPSTGYSKSIYKISDISMLETELSKADSKHWYLTIPDYDFLTQHTLANDTQIKLNIQFKKECPFNTYYQISSRLEYKYKYKCKS